MNQTWGTASANLTDILKQLSSNSIYKAAANVEAAQMINGDQGGQDAGPGPTMSSSPQPTMADQLRQLADMEPDMGKKQVLLSAADNLDSANAPVTQQQPPQGSMNPQAMDPQMMAQDPAAMGKVAKVQKRAFDNGVGEVAWDADINPTLDKYADELSEEEFLATLR